MKVKKPNVLKQLYAKFLTHTKKTLLEFLKKNIENILKLKGITKFNMIMIISYFYLNSYKL